MRPCIACCLVLAGCGDTAPHGTAATDDAGVNRQAHCTALAGLAFFIDNVTISGGPGLDLNGDGQPDNRLAPLAASDISAGWMDSIANGRTILLNTYQGYAAVEGNQPDVALSSAVDGDAIPTNNTQPGSPFRLSTDQFDVDCHLSSGFDTAVVRSGAVHMAVARKDLIAPGIGALELNHVLAVAHISADEQTLDELDIGMVVSACALSRLSSPISEGALLDVILFGWPSIQPDLDTNGNPAAGTIRHAGPGLYTCTPAGGEPVTSATCPCDVLADQGYSGFLILHGIRANLLPDLVGAP